jgi:two-component system sensor histidine kinase HydH
MSLLHYPGRLLVVTTASSLLLLVASVGVAVYVNSEQARTADVLGENVESRRAAANLEETLLDLIELHASGVTAVQPLQDRIASHLQTIEQFADKQDERETVWRIADSFAEYRTQWEKHGSAWAAEQLRTQMLPACQRLREFNATQIEESERDHRQALKWMGWGFTAVGMLGSIAGVVLGYGLARGLRRAVNSLLVRVQGASDLLSPMGWKTSSHGSNTPWRRCNSESEKFCDRNASQR